MRRSFERRTWVGYSEDWARKMLLSRLAPPRRDLVGRRAMAGAFDSRSLDRRLVDQHDGDIVSDRIDPVTLGAFQTLGALAVLQRLLARRTHQHLQQIFGNHDPSIVRHRGSTRSKSTTETHRPRGKQGKCLFG